jgi:membrane protease YdiL (CAAX protease family)
LAAPLFWTGLLLWEGTAPDLAWPAHAPGNFLKLALVFPVVEELAFRGFLQGALYKTAWGKRIRLGLSEANMLTSLIFALAHLFSHSPLWAGLTIAPSLVFGFFRDRYDGVMSPIILHIFYNTGYFWLFGSPTPSM